MIAPNYYHWIVIRTLDGVKVAKACETWAEAMTAWEEAQKTDRSAHIKKAFGPMPEPGNPEWKKEEEEW